MEDKELFLRGFPKGLRPALREAIEDFRRLQEIRLRVGQPVLLTYDNQEWFLTQNGRRQPKDRDSVVITLETLRETMSFLSNYSIYAVEQDLCQGFLTMPGGHRVGICGKMIREDGKARSLRDISSMNFRVAHEYPGCATKLMQELSMLHTPLNVLLVSPPGCGKTTLLRDLILQLSVGGYTVGVVDERSEIAASYQGIPGLKLGPRTDILDATPKALGMQMLLRSMAPDYIAVDEIGGEQDVKEIWNAIHSGCRLVATCHGANRKEVLQKPGIAELISRKCFQGIVYLSRRNGVGTIEEVEHVLV